MSALLSVEDLRVGFTTEDGVVQAVDGVSFDLAAGEVLAIVGESGSGKSVTAQTLLGLTRASNSTISGSVRFGDRELTDLGDRGWRDIRGEHIAMVFQDPMCSLNPVYRVGDQISEMIRAHRDVSRGEARDRAIELLRSVGIPNPERRVRDYPHEFSGGMRQRVMIAMALSLEPDILIADEPTTALDVTIQAQILRLIEEINAERDLAVILITHDLGVVAEVADRVLVMYAGQVVEDAGLDDIFYDPQHPYTWGLLGSLTPLDLPRHTRLPQIGGSPPSLLHLAPGCRFAPRCPHVFEQCAQPPALAATAAGAHRDRCWLEPAAKTRTAQCRRPDRTAQAGEHVSGGEPLLQVTDLVKHFPIKSGIVIEREVGRVRAVDGVSLEVRAGETLGLVGESGAESRHCAGSILQLTPATSGSVRFDGRELVGLSRREMRPVRRQIQMVFQDPYASLNPRKRVGQIIGDPMELHGLASGAEVKRHVQDLLDRVGLQAEHYNRYPHEFSGGQRQRIGIARALALRPKLIVADEPVSALDVSVQAQIVNLLEDLQDEFGLSYLFVAHDLGVVRHVSDRVAVMYLGKIVETADSDRLYNTPIHPYSNALLSAVPVPDPRRNATRERVILEGDVPSPIDPPSGCRFHTRCRWVTDVCIGDEPSLVEHEARHLAACYHPQNLELDLDRGATRR